MGAAASGAAVWWWNSEYGRKTRENMQDSMEDFKDYIRPQIRKFKRMSGRKFQEFMGKATEQYAKMKNMPKDKANKMKEEAEEIWEDESEM